MRDKGLPRWLSSKESAAKLGQEDPLQEEMATHSSFIACKIPQTEKSGRLQSMEWQKS